MSGTSFVGFWRSLTRRHESSTIRRSFVRFGLCASESAADGTVRPPAKRKSPLRLRCPFSHGTGSIAVAVSSQVIRSDRDDPKLRGSQRLDVLEAHRCTTVVNAATLMIQKSEPDGSDSTTASLSVTSNGRIVMRARWSSGPKRIHDLMIRRTKGVPPDIDSESESLDYLCLMQGRCWNCV